MGIPMFRISNNGKKNVEQAFGNFFLTLGELHASLKCNSQMLRGCLALWWFFWNFAWVAFGMPNIVNQVEMDYLLAHDERQVAFGMQWNRNGLPSGTHLSTCNFRMMDGNKRRFYVRGLEHFWEQ